ncbi:hypothetical protein ACIBL3_39215 [Kribbella sp. NPDC050124]|uniref:hypothetical protein n=1 Tax=Kribbella sp. NPDC050124 TaxID=3364114 RepID=UPI0037B3748F
MRSSMAKGFEIKFNKGWEKDILKAAQKGVEDEVRKSQALLDRLLDRYKGQPVSTVKPVLLSEWRRSGGSMTDAEATDWATLISQGTRIELRL